jgi:copper chaperone CopZ
MGTINSTQTYAVAGMTCGHCVHAVTDEVKKLPGVLDVTIDLVPDGSSNVHVVSVGVLDDAQVRDAVDEAGYELVDASR